MNAPPPARLSGWKSIAGYLGRDRTTAMRWAASRGLPIHQVPGGKRASVFALRDELYAWLNGAAGNAAAATDHVDAGRRAVVVAGLIAGVAATGIFLGTRSRPGVPRSIEPLMDQARVLLYQNTRETQNQAIGLYQQAVRAEPENADAWGMLGHAYASASHWREADESMALRERAEDAGRRSLEIDRESALGELALANAYPFLGVDAWLPRDQALRRALAARPDNPDILFLLAYILRFTGHSAEAVALCERIAPAQRSPAIYNVWIRSLWSVGRTAEALRRIDAAAALYPSQRTLWQTRLEVLTFSGRPDEASRIARDEQGRPGNVSAREVADAVALASHLGAGWDAGTDEFLQSLHTAAPTGERAAISAIRFAAAAGRLDQAFAIIEAYFFARGFVVAETIGNGLFVAANQRHTNFLFEPPLAPVRADPRFASLMEWVGLAQFWRAGGRPPDYRGVIAA